MQPLGRRHAETAMMVSDTFSDTMTNENEKYTQYFDEQTAPVILELLKHRYDGVQGTYDSLMTKAYALTAILLVVMPLLAVNLLDTEVHSDLHLLILVYATCSTIIAFLALISTYWIQDWEIGPDEQSIYNDKDYAPFDSEPWKTEACMAYKYNHAIVSNSKINNRIALFLQICLVSSMIGIALLLLAIFLITA